MRPIHALAAVLLLSGCHLSAQEGPDKWIPLLEHKDLAVRFEAAYALASLGAEARPAVPTLIEMLHSGDSDTTEIATLVLARIAPDPAIEPAVPLLIETVQSLDKGWTAQVNAAVALLRLGREEEKARAVLRDELYLSQLLPLLRHRQPVNRLHVCEVLMFAGLPRRDILDQLRKTAAEDADARVRKAAAEALRKIGAAAR